jgi:hypothetical protein
VLSESLGNVDRLADVQRRRRIGGFIEKNATLAGLNSGPSATKPVPAQLWDRPEILVRVLLIYRLEGILRSISEWTRLQEFLQKHQGAGRCRTLLIATAITPT